MEVHGVRMKSKKTKDNLSGAIF